jgi:DNA-binding transcriptional MerR regulator/methylmalonyl-CoA mutase cobalamin-binding subunit
MSESTKVARYPIRAVSKLTGIGIDTLRAWERRYKAVTPSRDDRGRLYTESDIARLRLLHRAVTAGHSVGRIAALSDADLQGLATPPPVGSPVMPAAPVALVPEAFRHALAALDTAALDYELSRLAAALSPGQLVQHVLLPAIRDAGDRWHRARGGIAHEHLLSATMRSLLGSFVRIHARRDAQVRLLFTTPAGDRHELGILGAALLAASRGLGVSYLGPDLPAAEIVDAARASRAQVIVLGLTLEQTGRAFTRQLSTMVDDMPPSIEIWAGGPAAARYADRLQPRALVLGDFDMYLQQLDRVGHRLT